jgi:hypothetical protein
MSDNPVVQKHSFESTANATVFLYLLKTDILFEGEHDSFVEYLLFLNCQPSREGG